jgi:molybdopterin converting factor small subunit
MRVKVRLFAQLRDLAGGGDLDCTVDAPVAAVPDAAVLNAVSDTPASDGAGTVRVQDVWRALVRDHPALASFTRAMSTAVNLEYARLDTPVRDGDEVAFLPPVSGG